VPVRDEDSHIAEPRFNLNRAIAFVGTSNFRTGRASVVRDQLAAGEAYESCDEIIGPLGRQIDAVFRNRLQCVERRCLGVPVQLHVDAAGPLNHRVFTHQILERFDDDVGSVPARGTHSYG
jgi:hypothetical protein